MPRHAGRCHTGRQCVDLQQPPLIGVPCQAEHAGNPHRGSATAHSDDTVPGSAQAICCKTLCYYAATEHSWAKAWLKQESCMYRQRPTYRHTEVPGKRTNAKLHQAAIATPKEPNQHACHIKKHIMMRSAMCLVAVGLQRKRSAPPAVPAATDTLNPLLLRHA